MPTYTYACDTCGKQFDVRQRFSEEPLENCLVCETQGTVYRVIQPAGIIFKGSGFYVTDNNGKNSAAPKNGSESNNGTTKAEASSNKTDSASSAPSSDD